MMKEVASYQGDGDDDSQLLFLPKPNWCDRLIFGQRVRMAYVALLCFLLGLLLPYLLATYAFTVAPDTSRGFCGLNVSWRFSCFPYASGEGPCRALGCCYDTFTDNDPYAPLCFHSVPSEYGYQVVNASGSTLLLQKEEVEEVYRQDRRHRLYRLGVDDKELNLDLVPFVRAGAAAATTLVGTPAWPLRAKIQRSGNDVVRFLLWSPEFEAQQFEDDFVAEPFDGEAQLEVVVEASVAEGDDPYSFNVTVVRRETNATLFQTVFGPLMYGDRYLEASTRLQTPHLYGLGQRDNTEFSPKFNQRERWTLYNRETYPATDGANSFGTHPFFMNFEKDGNMFGVYLRNSGPLEVAVVPAPAVVFRAVEGVLDFRILAGPSPSDVSRQYTALIGRPDMPPYWALGFHLCRSASRDNQDDFENYNDVQAGMEMANIPYDSDCIDAHLAQPDTFAPLSNATLAAVEALQASGRRWVLVQEPFVAAHSAAYNLTRDLDLLLKVNETQAYYGQVDGQAVGYPDYLNTSTLTQWLSQDPQTLDLFSLADGLMLLRNTPLNQATLNYDRSNTCSATSPEHCCEPANLPFVPVGLQDVNRDTVCAGLHHGSGAAPHLRLHNSYGLHHHARLRGLMQKLSPSRRPFITSQSTHPGSGSLGGHFGGDHPPDFVNQRKDLMGVLEAGLYGVASVGVPVCGSVNDTHDFLRSEWCLRAYQTAAFHPLMVSHYLPRHQPRNPPDFPLDFRNQLTYYVRQRYMILPYLYTLYHQAHLYGTPVARPLFYQFPHDLGSRHVGHQFMLGSDLLVAPVFRQSNSSVAASVITEVHFPPGAWYGFYTGTLIVNTTTGTDLLLPALMTDVLVFARGGSILPLQGNLHDESIGTTEDTRYLPFYLMVALSTTASTPAPVHAEGSMYVDDGVTPLTQDASPEQLHLAANVTHLTVTRLATLAGSAGLCGSNPANYTTLVDVVKVYGAPNVAEVRANDQVIPQSQWTQDADSNALTVRDLAHDWCLAEPLVLAWG